MVIRLFRVTQGVKVTTFATDRKLVCDFLLANDTNLYPSCTFLSYRGVLVKLMWFHYWQGNGLVLDRSQVQVLLGTIV